MARVPWRRIRIGTPYEKEDRTYNEGLAERLLSCGLADDFAIALDQVDWKIVPCSRWLAGERWPLNGDPKLKPSWACSASELERMISRNLEGMLVRHRAD